MKKLVILLIGVTLVFTACKKKLDQPDITPFPSGTEWTVGQILDTLATGTFQFDKEWHKNAIVKGYVIADETGGNIYRTFYLRGTDGKCIAVYRKGASDGGSDDFNVKVGDYIGYSLYGSIISEYSKLPQIQVQEHDVNKLIVIYKRGCYDEAQPVKTTIARINAGEHLCDLVQIDSVQFEVYEGLTYAEGQTNTNRSLVSCAGESIIVRTSGYASFAAEPLPSGKGRLTSIASVYNTTWQLLIRNTYDVNLNNPRCGEGGETMEMPYAQIFSASFGTYTTYSVVGDQVWEIAYNTAKMTGYANQTNYENEDWLISSPVNVSSVEHAKAVISYIAKYTPAYDDDVTIQISSDYVYGDDPTTATWTQLSATLPNTSGGWSDFETVEISLDDFIGQIVTFAVKFKSSTTQSRTIEIQSITIQEGEAGGGGGGGGELQQMPYTQDFSSSFGTYTTKSVIGSQMWEIAYSTAKMTGYVGGTNYENEDWLISSPVAITGVDHAKAAMTYIAKYTPPSDDDVTIQISSDYVYGGDPTTATWTQLSATLPNTNGGWDDFENVEINLDEFIGQTVTFAVKFISTDQASRTIEIKSITVQEGGDTPPTPPTGDIFNETFATGQGGFTVQNVVKPSSVANIWVFDSQFSCMIGNAFISNTVHEEAEGWLISPSIDLNGYNSAIMTFDHAFKFAGNAANELTLWVSTDYEDGAPSTAHWEQVEIPNYPTGSNWTFVSSNDIDLSEYLGNSNFRFAFKYMGTTTATPKWEIKNVVISE